MDIPYCQKLQPQGNGVFHACKDIVEVRSRFMRAKPKLYKLLTVISQQTNN
ncbi:hypothetical protein JYQ62_35370 [Nostoc sp. UHCC 0702]|nr:hypothetical protein JYQ62_35370 [Nostoc sp. UHCC 0702]